LWRTIRQKRAASTSKNPSLIKGSETQVTKQAECDIISYNKFVEIMKFIEVPNFTDPQPNIYHQLVIAWRNERLPGYLKYVSIALESLEVYQIIEELYPVIDYVSFKERNELLHKASLVIEVEYNKRRKMN
jgi:hypothetical protein